MARFVAANAAFPYSFCYCRVCMNGSINIFHSCFHTNCQCTFTNQICCTGSQNMYTQHFIILLTYYKFNHPFSAIHNQGLSICHKRELSNRVCNFLFFCFFFCQSYSCKFRFVLNTGRICLINKTQTSPKAFSAAISPWQMRYVQALP